jgi:hypothetical protein
MLRYPFSGLPVPESTTAREETWSMAGKMVGQGNKAGEELVCTIISRLAVRRVGV